MGSFKLFIRKEKGEVRGDYVVAKGYLSEGVVIDLSLVPVYIPTYVVLVAIYKVTIQRGVLPTCWGGYLYKVYHILGVYLGGGSYSVFPQSFPSKRNLLRLGGYTTPKVFSLVHPLLPPIGF